MPSSILRRHFCVLATFLLLAGQARAVVLDWDTVTWNNGDLTNTYQPDLADPGSAITISVTANNGAPIVPYSGGSNPMTPAIGTGFQGGLPTTENTLMLAVDLTNSLQSITITVSFAPGGGATGVSFTLFDIDAGGPYQDQLSLIRALSVDGTTLIAPTITTSANNTLIGTGINQSVVGNATTPDSGAVSGRANVTIDFGLADIQSFTFTYGSTVAFLDPAYQHFGIHDISYTSLTPVPEINPALISAISCLATAGFVFRRRLKVRK